MMTKTYLGLALCACALNTAQAILGTLTLAPAGAGLAITGTAAGATAAGATTFLTPAGAVILGGGVIALKALALASLGSSFRQRRSTVAEEDDLTFAALAQTEPAQCYRRLICDLATGHLPRSENDVIVSLFDKPVPIQSAKFDFATAAAIGKQVRSIRTCELRFSCPLSGDEIQKLMN